MNSKYTARLAAAMNTGMLLRASDWHWTSGEAIAFTVAGKNVWGMDHNPVLTEPWSPTETMEAFDALTDKPIGTSKSRLDKFFTPYDPAISIQVEGPKGLINRRFRVHAKLSRGGLGFNLRILADDPMPLSFMQTPPEMVQLMTTRTAGLILVCGQTGSGKSSTLSALVDHYIKNVPGKVVTYEAPIEVIFKNAMSLVQQHEVGPEGFADIGSFIQGTLSSMREAPKVIMFGELREPDALRHAVEAAETGHLVLGTMHTGTAEQSISRLLSAAPEGELNFFRQKISTTLLAVLCQRLIPHPNPVLMRRAVYEQLLVTAPVAGGIARGDTHAVANAMATGHKEGMFTFDEYYYRLVHNKEYSVDTVLQQSPNPRETLAHIVARLHPPLSSAKLAELRKLYQ